jgi:ankyrin repeat protein
MFFIRDWYFALGRRRQQRIDAPTILLQHDVNKDAQDCHDQTPLFLAAREGSCEEAVKQLLEQGVNWVIADHMDRQPSDLQV